MTATGKLEGVFVHPQALVESETIGEGSKIWAFAHVMRGASIGTECNLGDHVFVEKGAVLGNQVTVKNGAMIWQGVHLEDGVFVGPGAVFTNDRHPRSPRLPEAAHRYDDTGWLMPTYVRYGATIGARAVVLCGLEVGKFAMVAAGAVVTGDVSPYHLVAGCPARTIGRVNEDGQVCNVR